MEVDIAGGSQENVFEFGERKRVLQMIGEVVVKVFFASEWNCEGVVGSSFKDQSDHGEKENDTAESRSVEDHSSFSTYIL